VLQVPVTNSARHTELGNTQRNIAAEYRSEIKPTGTLRGQSGDGIGGGSRENADVPEDGVINTSLY
jgi:hypothetical protein